MNYHPNQFLDTITARTFGHLPMVEPRLASRFEVTSPLSATAASNGLGEINDPLEIEEEITATPVSRFSSAHTAPRSPRYFPSVENEVEPSVMITAAESPPSKNVAWQPEKRTATTHADVPVSAPPQRQPALFSTPSVIQPVPLTETLPPALAPRVADLPQASRLRPQRLPQLEPPIVAAESSRDSDRQNERPAVATTLPATQPSFTVAPTSQIAPYAAPSPVERPAVSSPVIKVTIGRVEVRAVMNAPAAPAPITTEAAPRSQALALDEYLRKRNNGEL